MDDDYEDFGAGFSLLPGIDLRLWLVLIAVTVGAILAAIGVALTVG